MLLLQENIQYLLNCFFRSTVVVYPVITSVAGGEIFQPGVDTHYINFFLSNSFIATYYETIFLNFQYVVLLAHGIMHCDPNITLDEKI